MNGSLKAMEGASGSLRSRISAAHQPQRHEEIALAIAGSVTAPSVTTTCSGIHLAARDDALMAGWHA